MLPPIDKLAWLHIEGRRLLAARTRGRASAYLPGGKREPGESDAEALCREVREELSVELLPDSLQRAGEFRAQADRQPEGVDVRMTCYTAAYRGALQPAAEIEAVVWLDYAQRAACSPVAQLVLDWARERDLID